MGNHTFSLKDKVAIVTGASRGIGNAIARGFAKQGANVMLASRNISTLEEAVLEIENQGGNCSCCKTDVTNEEEIKHLIETTVAKFGNIDILVNNAGISPAIVKAETLSRNDWEIILSTNLTGSFLCAREVGKIMIKQNKGCIINITSFSSVTAVTGLVAYSAAKAGIVGMTKVLALEWARYNIRVNAIGPGYIETDMNKEFRESKGKIYQHTMEKIPMKRFGKPEEIAAAAIFLASEEASYITGQTLFVEGGWLTC